MFSPETISVRVAGMLRNYDYITPRILSYFEKRLSQAPRDADFALDYVKHEARTPETQQAALRALTFKCDMLRAMLDALHFAYVEPALTPPGAFRGALVLDALGPQSVPRLRARLSHDQARERWLLLAPERIFEPNDVALAVLRLVDGERSVQAICEELGRN